MRPDKPAVCPFCSKQGLISRHCLYCNTWAPPDNYPRMRWKWLYEPQEEPEEEHDPDTTPPLTGDLNFSDDEFSA